MAARYTPELAVVGELDQKLIGADINAGNTIVDETVVTPVRSLAVEREGTPLKQE